MRENQQLIFSWIADRKLCFGLFCHSFALLRTSSDPEPKPWAYAKGLRRGRISTGDPSAYASGWQKRGHSESPFFVILNGALAEW